MDLPTYTSIWRIEKRLYKLYDFRLPMPVPVGQIAVFAAITVPYVILLTILGLPFNHTLFWLYVLPPGVITWLATRPVLESKRLPELIISQVRYLGEPGIWCRMAPWRRRTTSWSSARSGTGTRSRPGRRPPPRPRRLPRLPQSRAARPACGHRPHAKPPRRPPEPSRLDAWRVLLRQHDRAPRQSSAAVQTHGLALRQTSKGRLPPWRQMRHPRSPTMSGWPRSAREPAPAGRHAARTGLPPGAPGRAVGDEGKDSRPPRPDGLTAPPRPPAVWPAKDPHAPASATPPADPAWTTPPADPAWTTRPGPPRSRRPRSRPLRSRRSPGAGVWPPRPWSLQPPIRSPLRVILPRSRGIRTSPGQSPRLGKADSLAAPDAARAAPPAGPAVRVPAQAAAPEPITGMPTAPAGFFIGPLEPETAGPGNPEPRMAQMGTAEPEAAEPELAEPELAEPEAAGAGPVDDGLAEPEAAGAGPVDDGLAEPEAAEPELAEPELAEPEAAGSGAWAVTTGATGNESAEPAVAGTEADGRDAARSETSNPEMALTATQPAAPEALPERRRKGPARLPAWAAGPQRRPRARRD